MGQNAGLLPYAFLLSQILIGPTLSDGHTTIPDNGHTTLTEVDKIQLSTRAKFTISGVLGVLNRLSIPENIVKPCSEEKPCKFNFTRCINGMCACNGDLVLASNGKECLNMIHEVGGKCREDGQCAPLREKFGKVVCIDQVCDCDLINSVKHEEKCIDLINLGQECVYNESCWVPNAECRQNVCACEHGFLPKPNNEKCLPTLRNIRDACEMDEQCNSGMGDGSICAKGLCICKDNHHFDGKMCAPDLPLGADCTLDVNCSLAPNVERNNSRVCFNNTCTCAPDFRQVQNAENYCTPSAANKTLNFWILNFVLIFIMFFISDASKC